MANDFASKIKKMEMEILALKTSHSTTKGTTAPTSSTKGSVGSLYSWVSGGQGHIAICTAVSGSSYTWQTLI